MANLDFSPAHLDAILNGVLDAIVTIKPDGTILTANPATKQLFGHDIEDLIGRNVSMLMPPKHAAAHDGYIQSYQSSGEAKIIGTGREVIGRRKDGTEFPLDIGVTECLAEGERLFVGIMRDVSERHEAERKLRESEFRLNQSRKFSHVGTWQSDLRTNEIYWSEGICPLFGYAEGQLEPSSENFLRAIHPEDREAVMEAAQRCIETGVEYEVEHRVIWPDGTVRWLLEAGDVLRDEAGTPTHLLGIVQDITRAKRAEAEIMNAKEDAERANQAKSEYLSAMSHELRTPMNAILGFAQLLESGTNEPLGEMQQRCVKQIMSGGRHLLELINDVLDLARVEAGAMEINPTEVTVEDSIAETLILVEALAAQKGIQLHSDLSGAGAHKVWVDPTRFRQVLLNLLSNAVKYNRDGGSVKVEVANMAEDMVRISVEDTGAGIAPDKQHELFQPFKRLGAEATEIEGTGIGLSISKQIVELMGGRLGFDSEPGLGTTFWVDLPIATANPIKWEAEPFEQDQATFPSDVSGAILYVEDNPANLLLMEVIVGRLDRVSMISAQNGEFGLELAARRDFDLILLDINLPGIDGFEVLRRLREAERTRDIPIIAISAAATEADVQKGIEAGFTDYLTKPIQIAEVTAAIQSNLGTVAARDV